MSEGIPRQSLSPWDVIIRIVPFFAMLALMFVAAGDWAYARGWWFVGLFVATMVTNFPIVAWFNPGIIRERMRSHKGTKPFDRWFIALSAIAFLAMILVAGFDAGRFGWCRLSDWSLFVGIGLYVLGEVPIVAAMCTNPFLEPTVRIQSDRGHHVITSGPYRFVRHPMYAGAMLLYPGMALVTGSGWSLVPTFVAMAGIVWRLCREERVLLEELLGYREYAERTKYRLLPGIW